MWKNPKTVNYSPEGTKHDLGKRKVFCKYKNIVIMVKETNVDSKEVGCDNDLWCQSQTLCYSTHLF